MKPGDNKYWRSVDASPLIEASLIVDEDAIMYGSVKSTDAEGDVTVLLAFEEPYQGNLEDEPLSEHLEALTAYTDNLELVTE